jgi:hypothetical protein
MADDDKHVPSISEKTRRKLYDWARALPVGRYLLPLELVIKRRSWRFPVAKLQRAL